MLQRASSAGKRRQVLLIYCGTVCAARSILIEKGDRAAAAFERMDVGNRGGSGEKANVSCSGTVLLYGSTVTTGCNTRGK